MHANHLCVTPVHPPPSTWFSPSLSPSNLILRNSVTEYVERQREYASSGLPTYEEAVAKKSSDKSMDKPLVSSIEWLNDSYTLE